MWNSKTREILVCVVLMGSMAGCPPIPSPEGPAGRDGATGAMGAMGTVGATGATGAAGSVGPAGSPGAMGAPGTAGLAGSSGPQGPTGPIGAQGPAGASPFQVNGQNVFLLNNNVGIGTATPQSRFQVSGSGSTEAIIETTGGPTAATLGFFRSGTARKRIQINAQDDFEIYQGTGSNGSAADRLFARFFTADGGLFFGGMIGIRRIATSHSLEVEGEAGKTNPGPFAGNSDRRIKQDIEAIESGLSVLDRVRVTSFQFTPQYREWHPSVGLQRHVGVIAQEFAEVFPDYVKAGGDRMEDGSSILQVDPWPLTIYAVAAIQELHAKHQADISELRAEIANLRSELLAQEQTVRGPLAGIK